MSACANYEGETSILVASYGREGDQLWLLDLATLACLRKITISFAENVYIDQYRVYTIAKTGLGGYIMLGCHFKSEKDLNANIGSMLAIGISYDLVVDGPDFTELKAQGQVNYFSEFEENYWSDEQPPRYKMQAIGTPSAPDELIAAFAMSQYDQARYLHIRDGYLHAIYNYSNDNEWRLRGARVSA
jgi:hypothetical protein